MKNLRLFTMTGLLLLFSTLIAGAANITSAQSGNWDVGTTWVGGVPPVAGDNVTIASSHTITVAVNAAAATITVAANASGTNGITINSGILLNVSGAITMTAPTTASTSSISVGVGTLQAASIAIPGSGTAGRNCEVSVSTGTITTAGSITFSGTAARAIFTSTGASTVNVAGNFGSGGTLTTSGTGTICFNGGAAQTIGPYTTYNNVSINNTSGGVTFAGATTIGGTLTVTTGTLTVGALTLTVSGATSVSGTLSITSATGAKTFTGDITINNGGTWSNTSANEAVSLGGNLQNNGTFNAGTGVYTFTGTTKTISGANSVSIPRLTVNGTVTNNIDLTVGTALAGSGGLTQGTGATLHIGGSSGIATLTATANPNTVDYNGSGGQTVKVVTYHNLIVTSTGGTVTLNGITINGNFMIESGTVASGSTVNTVSGNLAVNGGSLTTDSLTVSGTTSVSGTMTIGGGAAQVVTLLGAVTVNAGGVWNGPQDVTLRGGLTHNGTTFNGTGTYTFDTNNQGIGGSSAITMGAVTVTGVTLTNNSTNFTVSTALSGTGELLQGTGATLNIGGTSGITTLTATASPNTVNYNGNAAQTVKPVTYHHLTLSGTTTTKTLTNVGTINGNLTLSGTATATTATAMTISGNLTVGTGTTFTVAGFNLTLTGTTSVSGTLAHSSATGTKIYTGLATINSGGSWTNAGNSAITMRGGLTHNGTTFSSGTGVYTFDTNNQGVGGTTALTIRNVTVTGITLSNNSTNFTVSTALSGTGELLQSTSATLNLGGTSGITTLTATANPNTVNYNGAAQTVKATAYHHLTLSGSGIKTLTNVGTINGDLTTSGTCSATTAIAMSVGGNLTVGSGTSFAVAGFDLTVTGTTSVSGTLAHSSATGSKTHTGMVTINSGGSWTNAGNSAFTFLGGLTHNGTTFTSGTGVYTFSTNAQAVGGTSALTISNVTVTGITLTNNYTATNFTVSTALSGTGELLQSTGATLNIGGTSGITTLTATANPNTVNYSGVAQTVKATAYHHLTLSGSGAKTMPVSMLTLNGDFTMSGTCSATSAATINTAGNFTVGGTNTFITGAFTHDIKGNFTNGGTFTATGSTIMLTGTADQSIGGGATTTFNNLTINKAGGTVTVSTTFNVSGMLTFTSGNINTGANKVVLTSSGTVSRTSGHVVGNFEKNVATGTNVSRTFEIGDVNNYTPVDMVFNNVSVSGNLTVSATPGDHPNITGSDVNPAKSVNRYWTLTSAGGLTLTNYSATFNFVSGDVDVGANTANFVVRRFSGGSWSSELVGTRTVTSTQINGAIGFGDFQVGNVLSVAVSNSIFAFGTQPANTWLAAQPSVITNDGTETETIVGKISTFTSGANTWVVHPTTNGVDTVRAQWSTSSETGPWNDIPAYDTDFTIATNVAANDSIIIWFRIETPSGTSSYIPYSSTLSVTAQ